MEVNLEKIEEHVGQGSENLRAGNCPEVCL